MREDKSCFSGHCAEINFTDLCFQECIDIVTGLYCSGRIMIQALIGDTKFIQKIVSDLLFSGRPVRSAGRPVYKVRSM